ncbi:MAG: FixH family protein [Bacteroidota bacterium]|nr:FixH family protein [Bacteroidota bacterium]
MSWGIRITVLYVSFMVLIVTMVVISSTSKAELVAKDYYAQELNYQQRITAITNEQELNESITHELNNGSFVLSLPSAIRSKDFKGELVFFRPSDSTKDVKVKLEFDSEGKQIIDTRKYTKGIYKICISWHNEGKEFYKEEVINL